MCTLTYDHAQILTQAKFLKTCVDLQHYLTIRLTLENVNMQSANQYM